MIPVSGEETPAPSLKMAIEPAKVEADPGPETIAGAASSKGKGTIFPWVDVSLEGTSTAYRVYFDRLDNENFHFLDRREDEVVVGLCEAGVEQVFARAKLEANGQHPRIARHGSQLGVFHAGKLALAAFDDRRMSGTVGVRRLNGSGTLELKAERRDDVHFADDFMREEKDASRWHKVNAGANGDFQIKNLRHPLLSANAFNYMGQGEGVMSLVGEPWWDNYRFEVSLRGPAGAQIGLVFAVQDDKNYGLFRWTARPVNADGSTSGSGKCELVRVRGGREEVLASKPGGYLPDQWYRAEVLISYARARIAMDGHVLFESADPYLAAGGSGLWCNVPKSKETALDPKALPFQVNSLHALMKQNAVFDDVKIDSVESIEDDFRQQGPLARGWLAGSGDWTVETPEAGQPGVLLARPGPWATKSLIGDRTWAQYEVECDVGPGAAHAGIVFLYRDESNYFSARTDGQVLQLVRCEQGKEEVVDHASLPKEALKDGCVRLKAAIEHGYIKVTAPGGVIVHGFEDQGILRGRAGLLATPGRGGEPARFRRFRLAFLQEAEPLVTTNAIFEDEGSMKDWTSPTSEWFPPRAPLSVEGQPVNLLWHRSQFPGDVELAVEPRQIQDEKHEIALSVSKDGKGSNNGYVFRYRAGRQAGDGKAATVLELLRQGEAVASRVLKEDERVRELSSLSVRRAGPYVVGKLNGRPALAWRDEHPLSGSRVAYYSRGVEVKVESAKIVSDHFRNELFSRAPVDWRTAGLAIAEVTNRWQCDPRWSFFSLKNDITRREEGQAAVLWSKHLYPGDVTVEFFVGNKMEGERGRPYTYARDINVTICSDGSDLTKGYTFMFGGQGNRGSYILRNGAEVRSAPQTVPVDMNFHRHWFSVRVEKRGNRLSYRVDRYFADPNSPARQSEGEMVFEDEQPLKGDRIALWTYDHAVMISRVRISGDGGTAAEPPGAEVPGLKTVYTSK